VARGSAHAATAGCWPGGWWLMVVGGCGCGTAVGVATGHWPLAMLGAGPWYILLIQTRHICTLHPQGLHITYLYTICHIYIYHMRVLMALPALLAAAAIYRSIYRAQRQRAVWCLWVRIADIADALQHTSALLTPTSSDISLQVVDAAALRAQRQ
jgi:hypothetical protein